jgi:hypothetical protein
MYFLLLRVFVLLYVTFVFCRSVCVCVCKCHRVATQLQLTNISFIILHPQTSNNHTISYHKFYVVSEFPSLLSLYVFSVLSTYSPCADHDGIQSTITTEPLILTLVLLRNGDQLPRAK